MPLPHLLTFFGRHVLESLAHLLAFFWRHILEAPPHRIPLLG
jgi:hypothetical protein